MNIEGLDMLQISKKMQVYLEEHFAGYVVIVNENGIFAEVFRLAYNEIEHLLIQPEQSQVFSGDEWFNGASGIFEISVPGTGEKETYIVMLVLDEAQTQALYLYVSRWDAATQCDKNILVKDFTRGGDA